MLDFLDGIYQYQANTSTSRNTTQSTTRSTTRSTTKSTSSTVDTSSNTTISTTASTTRSTTTTFNTTFSTSYTTTYTTTYNTSYTTSYSTSIPVTREPSSGWYHNGGNGSGTHYWDVFVGVHAVWGGTTVIDIYSNGGNGVPGTATSATGYDGKTYLRGPITNSDIALKTDIAPARNYLDTVNSIPVHTFKYKSNVEDEPILGVMAQEVEAVAPELMTNDTDNGFKAVYPQQIQYAMLKAIQELTSKVEDLENKIKSM
tara:strand:- start:1234 stop:2007 length:774 start_codon:yes stop_codon:yes gene_type:complete